MPVAAYPPRLRAAFPGANYLAARRNILGLLKRAAATGSDVVGFSVGPRRVVLLNHPDLARELFVTKHDAFIKGRILRLAKSIFGEGLLTSEGASHRRQRKLILPAFHQRRLAAYAEMMTALSAHQADAWQDGQVVSVNEEMMRLTLQIVAKTLFNADVQEESDEIDRALTASLIAFERVSNPLAELLNKLPLPRTRRLRQARRRLDETIYRIIAERRRQEDDRGDLLSILLAARDEESGAPMDDRQIRDEAMTLFLAGHETMAQALTWTWFLLAQHPDAEARLGDELDDVLGDRPPAFDDIPRLVYTRQVLSESMRLLPPVWAVSREALHDVELGGYTVRRGTTVLFSQYLIHRDARFWPEPKAFRPERFAPEARAGRHKFAYLPFSAGIRGCIGEQFAWTEGVLVLAALARRWKLRLADDAFPGLYPSITLRPARDIIMRCVAR